MRDKNSPYRSKFVDTINYGYENELRRYGVITTTVSNTDTNISVLKKMTEIKTDLLIVRDEHNKIKGVVERQQILSKLLLSIAK